MNEMQRELRAKMDELNKALGFEAFVAEWETGSVKIYRVRHAGKNIGKRVLKGNYQLPYELDDALRSLPSIKEAKIAHRTASKPAKSGLEVFGAKISPKNAELLRAEAEKLDIALGQFAGQLLEEALKRYLRKQKKA